MMRNENKKYGENYDLSMADLFAGFLFIFILLLVFFMAQLEKEKSKPLKVRHELLQEIKKELAKKNLDVTHDPLDGVLLLKDSSQCSYFESSRRELSACGKNNFKKIKQVFQNIIPCYVDKTQRPARCARGCLDNSQKPARCGCPDDKGCLDSILIEGHADPETFRRNSSIENNLHLSIERARTAYSFLLDYKEVSRKGGRGNQLYRLRRDHKCQGPNCGKIFGVSGYGASRPSSENKSLYAISRPSHKNKSSSKSSGKRRYPDDRRIEVRFITKTPSNILQDLKDSYTQSGQR